MNVKTTLSETKNIRWIGLLLLLLCSTINESYASHMAGGDIEYTCIGPRRWNIKLTIYRFCEGIPLCSTYACTRQLTVTPSPPASLGGLNPDGCVSNPSQFSVTVALQSIEDIGKGNIARCGASAKNGCDNMGQVAPGSYRPSIEKYVFAGTLDMSLPSLNTPATCPYWDIAFVEGSRNEGTVNVQNPGGTNFCIQATINIADRSGTPCFNSSPVFKNEPLAVFCGGQESIFNMGAVDPDRDSLSYLIVKSLSAPNVPINYNLPFSERWPFPLVATSSPHSAYPGTPFVVLDSTNGDLALTANNPGPTPIGGDMSVKIYQWSYREQPAGSGKYVPYIVGTTMRNLQIYSIPCQGNNPPRFATNPAAPDGGPQYNWTVCAGEQVCFEVTAKDTDYKPAATPPRTDSTYLSWNKAIVRMPGKVTFKPLYDSVTPRSREDAYRFCWQTELQDASPLPYYFTIQGEDNFCPNPGRIIHAFSIKVQGTQARLVKEEIGCGNWELKLFKANSRQLFNTATLEVANQPNDYSFAGGATVIHSTDPNPPTQGTQPVSMLTYFMQAQQAGKYYLRYTVTSTGMACPSVFYDSVTVLPFTAVPVTVTGNDEVKCINAALDLSVSASGGLLPYQYRWYRNSTNGSPVNSVFTSNQYLATDKINTRYIIQVRDSSGCLGWDSINLTVKPNQPLIQGQQTGVLVNTEYDYSITAQPGSSYKWNIMNGSFISSDTIPDVRVKWTAAGTAKLSVEQTFDGCTASDSITLTVGSTGLDETSNIEKLSINPNPNNGSFVINLEAKSKSHTELRLYDALGAVVLTMEKDLVTGNNQIKIDSHVSPGVYLLMVQEAGSVTCKRILIKQ